MKPTKVISLRICSFLLLFLFGMNATLNAQSSPYAEYQAQLTGWMSASQGDPVNASVGVRYIPQYNFTIPLKKERLIDMEASMNLFATSGYPTGNSPLGSLGASPYRMWARYSSNQFELRVGLQKISFGVANSLRPLMWFDQIDPRDPLRLTNGVWGGLGRYYFLNNANLWFWVLWGNEKTKGWEVLPTSPNMPEAGGRFQFPVKRGELAVSYHYRMADSRFLPFQEQTYERIPENRMGFDAKFDLGVGLWLEGSWIHKYENVGILTDQTLFNAGMDYTFGLGNGLNVSYEQLITSYDETPFAFSSPSTLSLLTVSYPIGMFDNLSAVVYYDWTNKNFYSFLNWKRDFEKVTLFIMGYWNTTSNSVSAENQLTGGFSGKGLQILLLFNH